ncbi:MAG: insulinase family protein [Myxococcales bacterium]|nr:insulinase family protein [Myxococcales bacterium]
MRQTMREEVQQGYRRHLDTLKNGLRVATVELPHLHSAALVVYAKVGSRYESPRDNGLSHFLEHMLFRGTERHPTSLALNFAIEELGGTLHAETGRDYSLYQITVAPELVSQGLAILGDIFRTPRFGDLALERQIVLEEIREDLDERGRDVNLEDRARLAMFPDHPLGQKITGPMANVRRFSLADVKRHFRRFYGASNLVLCVSGKVTRRSVLAAARKHLGELPPGRPATARTPKQLSGGPRFFYLDNPGSQTALQLLFRAVPEYAPDYVAMQALLRVLDDGMSTRLHYTLCDQLGLAYYVGASIEPYHDAALFELSGASSHGKFPELVRRMLGLCDALRSELVTEKELAKAKVRYRTDLLGAIDEADSMAGWFGGTELFYPAPDYRTKIDRMERVTRDDLRRVANFVLTPSRLVAGAAGYLTTRQRKGVAAQIADWR